MISALRQAIIRYVQFWAHTGWNLNMQISNRQHDQEIIVELLSYLHHLYQKENGAQSYEGTQTNVNSIFIILSDCFIPNEKNRR